VYLNYNRTDNVEGFGNTTTIQNLIKPSDKIETLISSLEHKFFNIKIWDNETKLIGTYNTNIPKTLNECLANDAKVNPLGDCPLSIWRPTPGDGFESIGDVMTRSLRNPSIEMINDVRKAKTPGAITEKNLSTISVTGVKLAEPEDYIYIGGFGKDPIIDRFVRNELFNKYSYRIAFYMREFQEAFEAKKVYLQNMVNQITQNQLIQFNKYVNQIKGIPWQCEVEDLDSYLNIQKFIDSSDFSSYAPLSLVDDKPMGDSVSRQNKVLISIVNKPIVVNHRYLFKSIIKGFPDVIKNILFKNYDSINENSMIKYDMYIFTIKNMSVIPIIKIQEKVGDELGVIIINDDRHNRYTTQPNVMLSYSIYYNETYRDRSGLKWLSPGSGELRTRQRNLDVAFGDNNSVQSRTICFEPAVEGRHNKQTLKIYYFKIYYHSTVESIINTELFTDEDLKVKYDRVISIINRFKQEFPQFNKTDYNRLSIWQPVPPPGYVALGFVFTNEEETVKPSKQLIKCVPQSCVKNFKRRPWIPADDIIYKYSDTYQDLVFYRNPFLGTIIVIDQKKQKGVYKNKTPNALKYRNEKDSLLWECYDIVPCVKECDFVDRLKDADKSAKQMCRAYRGIENQIYDKTESKQTLLVEEEKLNKLLNDKKQYIDNLITRINSVMSEDELYKLIIEGINRYKTKKDLQEQHQLHGKVADKLLQTRGLEISWDVPEEMMKFKDLLKDFVVAQYGRVSQEEKDCPVCKLPDTTGYVKMKDLELCYGCLEDVVRELVGKKKAAGEPIPAELQELQNKIV